MIENSTVLKTKRPVPQICKPRLSMLRKRLTKFKLRNSEVRRSIAQFGQNSSKNKPNGLSRHNRLFTWWKLILLKIALVTYFKVSPSNNKVLLIFNGAKRTFGTKIEQKLSSAIKMKLNANFGMPQAPKFMFNPHALSKKDRHITRNRKSTITSGHQNSYFTIDKSRNFRQYLRTTQLSIPGLNSWTPAPQELKQMVVMSPKKK